MTNLKLVPELYCSDIHKTKEFYLEVFGFEITYERQDEQFIYFTLDGVDLMVEGINETGRRWLTDEMKKPYGRGVNFQWDVLDINSLYAKVQEKSPSSIYLEMETKEYQCGDKTAVQ